ncbi:MAG: hypothetical protein QM692_21130 [Thermomicrobiales bacterium]
MTTLPTLTGTDKQIAWATDLRAQRLREMEARQADFERQAAIAITKGQTTEAEVTEGRAHGAAVVADILSHTEAKWWIDQRQDSVIRMMREVSLRLLPA